MVISFISYKGGVGKTTLSENVAVCFAHAGRSVCIVDADDSANSLSWSSRRVGEMPKIDAFRENNKEEIALKIKEYNQRYDVVVIDSPPSQTPISDMIVLMSNLVIVPLLPKGEQETNTINQLVRKIKSLEAAKEKKIPVYFVINEFDARTSLHRNFAETMEKTFGDRLLSSKLHNRVAYAEVTHEGKGVFEHADQKAKEEVTNLFNELVNIIKAQ
jgi:chromosome partitioning protein